MYVYNIIGIGDSWPIFLSPYTVTYRIQGISRLCILYYVIYRPLFMRYKRYKQTPVTRERTRDLSREINCTAVCLINLCRFIGKGA